MSDILTLSEILGRGVSLEWPEAVAVVCGVAERLISPDQSNLLPDLDQIQLSSSGEINLAGGTRVDEPVRRLGQLLQATLGNSDPPVQLRLMISQAMAPTPTFGSVAEFEEALRYFERPDRDVVIRALFARAAAVPSRSDSTAKPTLNTVAPLSGPVQSEGAEVRATLVARRRRRLLAVGAMALVILAVGWLQYGRMKGAGPVAGEMSVMVRKASDAVGSALLSVLSAVTERVGMGRLVSRDAIGEVAAPTAAAAPTVTEPGTRQTSAVASSTQSSPISPRSTPVLPDVPVAPLLAFDLEELAASPVSPDADPVDPPTARPSDLADEAADPAIYSAESPGVLPPVGVRPQIPTDLPPNISRQDLVTIELIVTPGGTVDSVRFLGEPRHMRDVMWLSAVKAWQFRPAVKDGRPVNYRKTVWIAPP